MSADKKDKKKHVRGLKNKKEVSTPIGKKRIFLLHVRIYANKKIKKNSVIAYPAMEKRIILVHYNSYIHVMSNFKSDILIKK